MSRYSGSAASIEMSAGNEAMPQETSVLAAALA